MRLAACRECPPLPARGHRTANVLDPAAGGRAPWADAPAHRRPPPYV